MTSSLDTSQRASGRPLASPQPTDHPAWPRWALVGVAVLPIVVAVLRAVAGDWQPVGDIGLLALRADDVGGVHHPWLGPWTSASHTIGVDVNNPGPWYAYLVSPFIAVFGLGIGIPLAVGVLNAGSVVGIAVASRTLGGAACERWMLVAAAALTWTMGSELLVDLWQPHALMLPSLLLLVLASGVAAGHARFLPWFTALTCFIVQTHIAYAYVLIVIVCASVVSGLVVRRDALPRSLSDASGAVKRSRTLRWSAVTALVMWLPAIVEQLIEGRRGNLLRLVRYAGGGDVRLGAEQATEMTARLFAIPPFWSRRSFSEAIPGVGRQMTADGFVVNVPGLPGLGTSLVALCLFCVVAAALFVFTNRTNRRGHRGALTVVFTLIGASLFSISLLAVGPVGFGTHFIRWLFVFAVFSHAVLAWVGAAWIVERFGSPRLVERLPLVALLVLVALALPAYAQDAGPVKDAWARATLHSIDAQLASISLSEPVFFEPLTADPYEPYSGPVMLWLAHSGVDFRVREVNARQVGSGRLADGTESGVLYQRLGPDALSYNGDDCVILTADGVTIAERKRLSGLVDDLTQRLVTGQVTFATDHLVGEPRLIDVLDAIRFGDDAKLRWHVVIGTLSPWAELGRLDSATSEFVAQHGPEIADWSRAAFGLYLHSERPCPDVVQP